MKMAFFHDSIFIRKDNLYYTSGTLNKDLFNFYLKFFDKISVVTRFHDCTQKDNRYINNSNLVDINKVSFNCIETYKKSIKIIEREILNCDIAIIRCHSIIGTIASFYAKKYHRKYIAESVSCAFDCLWYHSLKGKFVAPIMYLLTKKVIKKAIAVTYVSTSFLQKRYPNNSLCLSCSDVILNDSLTFDLNDRLNRYNSIEDRKIIIGNISNIDMKYKGHKYLIKAISKLIKQGYNIELQFVGGGTGGSLKKLVNKYGIKDNVIFVGTLPHEKIFDYINDIDIYVQPSNAESHGRVIVEAMSLGCPIIGSNAGGIPELVNSKYVFKKANFNDLYRKLKLMISNSSNIKECAIYSYNKAQQFKYKDLLEKKYQFYEKVMEEIND